MLARLMLSSFSTSQSPDSIKNVPRSVRSHDTYIRPPPPTDQGCPTHMTADRWNSSSLIPNRLLSKFHACTNESLWVRKITDPLPPPADWGCSTHMLTDRWKSYSLIPNRLLSKFHACTNESLWVCKNTDPPPWQTGDVQLIWRQTGENRVISSQIDFLVILRACTDESPSPGKATCFPTHKLPMFRDPAGKPIALLFPVVSSRKIIFRACTNESCFCVGTSPTIISKALRIKLQNSY